MEETIDKEEKQYEAEHLENRFNEILDKIIAVRHGESIANTLGIYQGQTYDTDLSSLGKKQADALAKRLTSFGIKKIIASPLKRTYQTAMEISRVTDIPIEINELILETNHGHWEGMSKEWIKKNYTDIYDTWFQNPSQTVFPNGEAFVDTFKRVETFLDRTDLTDNTLLVTHDNIIRIMVTLSNGWTLDDIWRHDIEPAALNFFEVNKMTGKNKLKILKLNDNIHLEGLRADLSVHAL